MFYSYTYVSSIHYTVYNLSQGVPSPRDTNGYDIRCVLGQPLLTHNSTYLITTTTQIEHTQTKQTKQNPLY